MLSLEHSSLNASLRMSLELCKDTICMKTLVSRLKSKAPLLQSYLKSMAKNF